MGPWRACYPSLQDGVERSEEFKLFAQMSGAGSREEGEGGNEITGMKNLKGN